MKTYAGIGSRQITDREQIIIMAWGSYLQRCGYTLLTGGADGADIAFQQGSHGDCCLMLPWDGFNKDQWGTLSFRYAYVCGQDMMMRHESLKHHPDPSNLSEGGKALMTRNYAQVMGYDRFPQIDFVLCCATPTRDGVSGGTGQAVRVAKHHNIPVFNIREQGFDKALFQLVGT